MNEKRDWNIEYNYSFKKVNAPRNKKSLVFYP